MIFGEIVTENHKQKQKKKRKRERMQTKLVLLGTGTPNACPNANGPSSAVVVGDRAYLVDFGPGVVRQASAAYFNGVLLNMNISAPFVIYKIFKRIIYIVT